MPRYEHDKPFRSRAQKIGFSGCRVVLVSLVLAVALLIGGPVMAGPICAAKPSPTLSEKLAKADGAALTVVKPLEVTGMDDEDGAMFTVQIVAKPIKNLIVGQSVVIPGFQNGKQGELYLLLADVDDGRTTWTAIPVSKAAFQYTRQLPPLNAKPAKRLTFFIEHLGTEDAIVARDIFDELRRADFADIRQVANRIPRDRLRRRLRDPGLAPLHRGLYCQLLGLCGDATDEQFLEELVKKVGTDDGNYPLGIGSIIKGYLLLAGERGLNLIDANRIQNRAASFAEVYAALLAVRFMWSDGNSRISHARLRRSLHRAFDVSTIRDLIIADFGKWQDWTQLDRVLNQFSEEQESWVRVATIRYALASRRAAPEFESNTEAMLRASQFLSKVAAAHPKVFRRATIFSTVGFQPPVATEKNVSTEDLAAARKRLTELRAAIFESNQQVVELNANRTRIQDDDLKLVAQFKQLTDLSLEKTQITDAGIEHLQDLPRLEWLNLYQTRVGDAGLKHLARFKRLKFLPIGSTRITDKGLIALKAMPQLTYLGLRDNNITDAGLASLAGLIKLEGLHLGETKTTDVGLKHITKQTNLTKLWLNETAITDASIPLLLKFKKLKQLQVIGTKLSPAGVIRLQQGLPACEIITSSKR